MNRVVAGVMIALLAGGAAWAGATFDPTWRVILSPEKARDFAHQCSRVSPGPVTGTWTPSAADIDALEPALAKLLGERLATVDGGHYASVHDYYRQYGGLIIGGRRIVYVGGVHRSAIDSAQGSPEVRDYWRREPVSICDGGPIVFGVEYDPATRTFSHFSFNGSI